MDYFCPMNYPQTLDWMFAQLPMYQREGKLAFKKDLTNILAFSKALDSPEKSLKQSMLAEPTERGLQVI